MKKIFSILLMLLALLAMFASATIAQTISKERVAVMPFSYNGPASDSSKQAMPLYLQQVVINFLNREESAFEYLSKEDMILELSKQNVTSGSIKDYSVKELADMLDVKYIITGSVIQQFEIPANSCTAGNTKQGNIYKKGYDEKPSKEKNCFNPMEKPGMETYVSLAVFDGEGRKLYGRSKHSQSFEANAYRNTIHYLLKRTFFIQPITE